MTLHADPPSTPAPPSALPDMPDLVIRMNKRPRVPLWYWLRHPWHARWITMLIREAFRWRNVPNTQPNALTWAEKALFEGAQQAQQKAVADLAKQINGLADQYQQLRAEARHQQKLAQLERERRFVPKTEIQIYAAGPITVQQAEEIIGKCRQQIVEDTKRGHTRHQEWPSKRRNVLSAAPLLVDIVALMTVIAKFFNVTLGNALTKFPETITAIGFSLIAALVLALLAHSAGDAAWQLRAIGPRTADQPASGEDQEFPSPRHVLYAKLIGLVVVSTMAAVSIATRVIHPTDEVNNGPLAWMIGILIGLAAFLAPWLIVLNRMRSGSLEARTIDALSKTVHDTEAVVTKHQKAAVKADQKATELRLSAERAHTDELQSAMTATAGTRQIVELARSYHAQTGRFAINDRASVDDPYDSMLSVLATDTSALDRAMQRFELSVDESHSHHGDEPGSNEP